MSDHLKGILVTTLGVLLVVPDSLFVRLIIADPLIIAFWRGLISGAVILLAVLMYHGPRAYGLVLKTGWSGVIYTILLASTTIGFVQAVTYTSVANVVFIFATVPVFAAIFSRLFLAESLSRRILITMAVVMMGLGVIAYGSGESELASWKGDLWALYTSAAYAAALTAVRSVKSVSMIPAAPFAYFGAALVLWFMTDPIPAFQSNWSLILPHGAFIGMATWFLTLGPRYISSAEVSLLILLESVLAPLLVWAVIGENPGKWALIGGVIVIGALLVSNLVAMRRRSVA